MTEAVAVAVAISYGLINIAQFPLWVSSSLR